MDNVFDLFAKISLDSSEYEKGLGDAKSSAKNFASSFGSAAKTVAGGAKMIGDLAIGMGSSIMDATGQVAQLGDNIDKASQKIGVSAEFYQEWDAVLQHSGTSMSAMSATFKTLAKSSQNATAEQAAAYEALGLSMDAISSMSAEELFGEVIGRLQGMEEGTERTAIALSLLGKGAQELGPLLNTSAEDTQGMIDTVRELGGVMSDDAVKAAAGYQDSLQDLTTAVDGIKNGVVSTFLPAMSEIMGGLTAIFSSGEGGVEQLRTGVENFIGSLVAAIPQVLESGTQIMATLGGAIISNLPSIIDTAFQVVITLASGITEALPELIPAAVQTIFEVAQALTSPDNLGALIKAALDMVVALARGLVNALPVLAEQAPALIGTILDTINQSLPEIMTAAFMIVSVLIKGIIENLPLVIRQGVELTGSIVTGLLDAVPDLIAAIPTIVMAIIDGFANVDWGEVGSNIIGGIGEGLKAGVSKVGGFIKDAGANMVDGFKDFFGIHSPSTLMKDKVGKFLADGIGEGFEDEMDKISGDMTSAIPTDYDIDANISGGTALAAAAGMNVTINIDKFNNYGDEDINTLTDKISRALYSKTVRKGAAY